jgi:hypothetical protein
VAIFAGEREYSLFSNDSPVIARVYFITHFAKKKYDQHLYLGCQPIWMLIGWHFWQQKVLLMLKTVLLIVLTLAFLI